ncbi:MAG: glycosyltransferase [Gemmatimonadaceae bacterium]|jgi:glycosyltransferase involved in cell wall biosynthesis|nr:glycosyltransferase [Gemmatimonadaceae bacterium]
MTAHRIVHVVTELPRAGMEVVIASLVRWQQRTGLAPVVVLSVRGGAIADELRDAGIEVVEAFGPPLRPWTCPAPLTSALRRLAPTVVHLHGSAWLQHARAARRALPSARVLYTMHGLHEPERTADRLVQEGGAMLTDDAVFVSEGLGDVYRSRLVAARRMRRHVVLNGSDAFERPWKPWQSEPGAPLVLGHLGRLVPVKRQEDMIEATALLRAQGRDVVLRIGGAGVLRSALEARAAALGIGAVVEFLGETSGSAAFLSEIDIFLLVSDSEGTSMSLLEAVAAARPVVATAVGGTPAVLRAARDWLVAPREPTAIARAVMAIADDPASSARAAQVRADVASRYSLDAMGIAYRRIYGMEAAG